MGSGRQSRRSRVPAPVLTSAARAALRSSCKLSRATRTAPSYGRRAPAGWARGPGRRRAGRALTWPAGQRLLLAPPQERNSRLELEGAGQATSRAAEPLRSPRYPFSVRPTRSAPLEASPLHSVAGGGVVVVVRDPLAILVSWASVPSMGSRLPWWTKGQSLLPGLMHQQSQTAKPGQWPKTRWKTALQMGQGATGRPQMSKRNSLRPRKHSLEYRLTHLGRAVELGSPTEYYCLLQTLGWQPSTLRSVTEGTG